MRCYAPPPPLWFCGVGFGCSLVIPPPPLWACGVGSGKFTSKQMPSDAFRLVMLNWKPCRIVAELQPA